MSGSIMSLIIQAYFLRRFVRNCRKVSTVDCVSNYRIVLYRPRIVTGVVSDLAQRTSFVFRIFCLIKKAKKFIVLVRAGNCKPGYSGNLCISRTSNGRLRPWNSIVVTPLTLLQVSFDHFESRYIAPGRYYREHPDRKRGSRES